MGQHISFNVVIDSRDQKLIICFEDFKTNNIKLFVYY